VKHRDSIYRAGTRVDSWLKLKIDKAQEFRDSRFRFQNNAVRLDAADRGIFVFFAVNGFEVLGENDCWQQKD
jgi:hypothetical protein